MPKKPLPTLRAASDRHVLLRNADAYLGRALQYYRQAGVSPKFRAALTSVQKRSAGAVNHARRILSEAEEVARRAR